MAPFTEIVAAVVAHSSVVALSHFGVVIEPSKVERPQPISERVVARSPRKVSDALEVRRTQPIAASKA